MNDQEQKRFNRVRQVDTNLAILTPEERLILRVAAKGPWHGGDPLPEPVRTKAIQTMLAFPSTGRLRMDVYRKLRLDSRRGGE